MYAHHCQCLGALAKKEGAIVFDLTVMYAELEKYRYNWNQYKDPDSSGHVGITAIVDKCWSMMQMYINVACSTPRINYLMHIIREACLVRFGELFRMPTT